MDESMGSGNVVACLFVRGVRYTFNVAILIHVCIQINVNFLGQAFCESLMCDNFKCVGRHLFVWSLLSVLLAWKLKWNETKQTHTRTELVYTMHMVSWWHHCWTVVVVRDSSSSCSTKHQQHQQQGFVKLSSSCSTWSMWMLAQIITFSTHLVLVLVLHLGWNTIALSSNSASNFWWLKLFHVNYLCGIDQCKACECVAGWLVGTIA